MSKRCTISSAGFGRGFWRLFPKRRLPSLADLRLRRCWLTARRDVVTFADFVPDLRPYLQRHAVFVAPIISGAGLRGKILEALAMGKAVVATRRSVEGYPFVHGQELMVAGTAQEFSQHVIDLLRDPARRAALGRMGRARVEAEFNCCRIHGNL